ncbi:DNA-3-methyladenine glycosylase I [Caproicibacter fermentans]|uniref:DNA-3-methyladenine glycosylase I n=1 Tax=Caproicibacter fermentans TaxID=2576756 RepID=A0A7G8T805_9FIRM|nr:DNA-3-methyladenine glycosylase I [Caproicibacter fermentans]QNK39746.1 DNA-3-methyladenine glycosylase I [Caproicibacter fermentans]
MTRCGWCESDDLYRAYHDEEWGVPVHDDRKHFEFLILESAQAGLSWITILRKRKAYRAAFDGFDPEKIAAYGEDKIEELMTNSGIIRNRRKIESAVNNARRFLEVQKEFGSFDQYIWGFVGGKPVVGHYDTLDEIPAKTELSEQVSRDLKKRGFQFLGPVIVYSHLQATGLVNDHLDSCFRKKLCASQPS